MTLQDYIHILRNQQDSVDDVFYGSLHDFLIDKEYEKKRKLIEDHTLRQIRYIGVDWGRIESVAHETTYYKYEGGYLVTVRFDDNGGKTLFQSVGSTCHQAKCLLIAMILEDRNIQ